MDMLDYAGHPRLMTNASDEMKALVLFPDPSLKDEFATQRDFGDKIKKTDALMAAAQVAVYPIAASGNSVDTLYGADQGANAVIPPQQDTEPIAGLPQGQRASQSTPLGQSSQQQEITSLHSDSVERNAAHTAMDEIAHDTGGEAFYNTNGLNEAIARASNDGSNFYTITYTPTNNAEDGLFRKIQVKLVKKTSNNNSGGNLRLSYRRGYYADKAGALEAAAASPAGDPLHPYMGPGMPASTQIPIVMRVVPGPVVTGTPVNERKPAPVVTHAGDNPDIGSLPGPTVRYRVDFVIAARGLELDQVPSGRHGVIETTVLVYGMDGRPLNWLVRQVNLDMDEARYAYVQQNGANFSFEIDVPHQAAFLRAGVYDQLSSLAGTLEVPLSSVQRMTSANPAAH
jgi:hypothetical protein